MKKQYFKFEKMQPVIIGISINKSEISIALFVVCMTLIFKPKTIIYE